jgi:uncharacterized membrane protein
MEVLLLAGLAVLAGFLLLLWKQVQELQAQVAHLLEGEPQPARVVRDDAPLEEEVARLRAPLTFPPRPAPELRERADMLGDPETPHEPPAPPESLAHLFERLVGGRLLIWIGGIALAVAGVLLVRFSMQIGLITPAVQMLMAGAFGIALLVAGEVARRRPGVTVDPRVAQALVGAGIVVLYATPYGALILYGLISKTTASALMVLVTGAALYLSLRHGPPTAVLGLLGGFATPALVGDPTESAIPLLTYLGLLDLALFVVAARRGWSWLAAAALLLSYAYTASLLFGSTVHALAAGIFIVPLAIVASLVPTGEGKHLARIRPPALGLVQLALIVTRDDLDSVGWGLYALLAAACFFLARLRPHYRPLPGMALALALLLLAIEAVDRSGGIRVVAAGITLLFAAGAMPDAAFGERRFGPVLTASLAFAGPALILRMLDPGLLAFPAWAALLAALAIGPAFLAWRRSLLPAEEGPDRPLLAAGAAALLLVTVALSDLLPREWLAFAWMLLALVPAFAARPLPGRGISWLTAITAVVALYWCVAMLPELWDTLANSLGGSAALATGLPDSRHAFQLLLLPALPLLALSRLLPEHRPKLRSAALQAGLALLGTALYVFFKQAWGLSDPTDFQNRGFAERMLITQFLFLLGWLVCTGRVPLPGIDEEQRWHGGMYLTGLAAARLVWFDMLLHNPVLVAQSVGRLPVLNLLLPAYLLSAFWLYRARRSADSNARSGVWLGIFLASLILGVMLMVRQLFQGPMLSGPTIGSTESYGYSLAGLLLSIALLLFGIRIRDKALRLAGLVLLTATILKVFLIDASALEGVLRILSFLGLGVALIGIGKLYTAVLTAEAAPKTAEA